MVSLLLAAVVMGTSPDAGVRTSNPGNGGLSPDKDANVDLADRFVRHLAAGRTDEAAKMLTPTMAGALPPPKLKALWPQLEAQLGAFRAITGGRVSYVDGVSAIVVDLETYFERTKVLLRVSVDGEGRVAGFFVRPWEMPTEEWTEPAYAKTGSFTETTLTIGTPALPAVLSLPTGKGPFPAVVLLHGSGPSDKDETVGAVKVFGDLAHGLASQGIAVLRFDKRTLVSPSGVKTVKEEVFDAVGHALAALKANPAVDARRIGIVGHSQGAELAPWIARDHPEISSVAMLAAPARPLMDLVVDQYEYLLSGKPEDSTLKAALEQARKDRERVNSALLKPDEQIFHASGEYYLALRGYDPVATAAKLKSRLFVAQGGRDYQVSPSKDFDAFKAALAGRSTVTFKLYPRLNHLFCAGDGPPGPAEYSLRGQHVDAQLVNDLAGWLKAQPK